MNLEDLTPGDTIKYLHPHSRVSKKMGADDAKFGTGRFVSIDLTGITVENNLGDRWNIQEHWIRWDLTEYYNNRLKTLTCGNCGFTTKSVFAFTEHYEHDESGYCDDVLY